jgi:hypothetical protein
MAKKNAAELHDTLIKEIEHAESLAGKSLDELRVRAAELMERATSRAYELENAAKALADMRGNLNTVTEERRGQRELIKVLRTTCSQLALGQSGAMHSEFVAAINRADEAERQLAGLRPLLEDAREKLRAVETKPSTAPACVICARSFRDGETSVCRHCRNDVAAIVKIRMKLGLSPLADADEVERAWVARSPPPATGLVPGWSLVTCSVSGCTNKVAVKRDKPVPIESVECTEHAHRKAPLLPPTLPGREAIFAEWLFDLTSAVRVLASRDHEETIGHRTNSEDAAEFVRTIDAIHARYRGWLMDHSKSLGGTAIEEWLLRVSWSCTPDHLVRRGEVMADVGMPPPDPPMTEAEMQRVTHAAKMELLRCLRDRKPTEKKRRALPQQHAPDCECPKHAGKTVKAERVQWNGDASVCGRFVIQKERIRFEPTFFSLMLKPRNSAVWLNDAATSSYPGYRECASKFRGDGTRSSCKHDAQVLADWEHENPQPDSKRLS